MDFLSFVEDYFNKGYHVTSLPDELTEKFWQTTKTIEWKIAIGDYSLKFPEQLDLPVYKELAIDVSNLPVFDVLKLLKKNIIPMKSYIWNGAEDITWHSDSNRGADITVFCYFTDIKWNKSFGGTVQFGQYLNGKIVEHEEVMPENGTLVIFNNINPLNLHRVKKLTQDINRYIFSFTYKWLC